ncbi:hypothetical protein N7527_007217 [Penicillium freii]|nr:hypothetical protein N7527_007217 [Penicillium freii]
MFLGSRALNVERASALNKTVLFNESITNHKSVTVLEAISADSFTCLLLIILSAKYRKFSKNKFLYSISEIRRRTFQPSQNTEFSTLKTAKRIRRISHRLNQYNPTTQCFKDRLAKLVKGAEACLLRPITGIISSSQVKEIKRKEYKLTEKADQEKRSGSGRRCWSKLGSIDERKNAGEIDQILYTSSNLVN